MFFSLSMPEEGRTGMNYAQVYLCDTANGIGCRTSLFVSGCTHHCKDCFNEQTWPFDYGKPFTNEVQNVLISETNHPYIDGFTILGGEPMELKNQAAVRPFLERIRRELPGKTIWIYSGYNWEELTDENNRRCHSRDTGKILEMTDVLVDGRFIVEKRDITLRFRGSSNQRIIDVPASLRTGKVIISRYQNNGRTGIDSCLTD